MDMREIAQVELPELPNQHQNPEVTKVSKRTAREREGKGSPSVLWPVLKDQTTVISSEHYNPSVTSALRPLQE